jgi:hypothetical protein
LNHADSDACCSPNSRPFKSIIVYIDDWPPFSTALLDATEPGRSAAKIHWILVGCAGSRTASTGGSQRAYNGGVNGRKGVFANRARVGGPATARSPRCWRHQLGQQTEWLRNMAQRVLDARRHAATWTSRAVCVHAPGMAFGPARHRAGDQRNAQVE